MIVQAIFESTVISEIILYCDPCIASSYLIFE